MAPVCMAASWQAQIPVNDNPMSSVRAVRGNIFTRVLQLTSLHLDTEPETRARIHLEHLSLLSELWMTEYHFVLPGGDRQVCQGRFADAPSVDPEFGPRQRIQIHQAGWRRVDANPGDFSGHDFDGPDRLKSAVLVYELDLVTAGRHS